MARSWEDRVGEYVDSPMLTARVRAGKVLRCRVHGNHGVYATTAVLSRRTAGSCTCPADDRPCKHIEALRRTHRTNRDSFFDVDAFLAGLGRGSRAELLAHIRKMILHSPGVLAAMGIEGFSDAEHDEDGEGKPGSDELVGYAR